MGIILENIGDGGEGSVGLFVINNNEAVGAASDRTSGLNSSVADIDGLHSDFATDAILGSGARYDTVEKGCSIDSREVGSIGGKDYRQRLIHKLKLTTTSRISPAPNTSGLTRSATTKRSEGTGYDRARCGRIAGSTR